MAYDDITPDPVETQDKNISKPQEKVEDALSRDVGGASQNEQTLQQVRAEKGDREVQSNACCMAETSKTVEQFLKDHNALYLSKGLLQDFDFSKMIKEAGALAGQQIQQALKDGAPQTGTDVRAASPAVVPSDTAYPMQGTGQPGAMRDAAPVRPPATDDIGAAMPGERDDAPRPGDRVNFAPRDVQAPGRDGPKERPNAREIDPAKDNPEAVARKYREQLDNARPPLSEQQKRVMAESFDQYMAKMKAEGRDMQRLSAAMNDIMDSRRFTGPNADIARLNTVVDTAAKCAYPDKAFGQGAHNTCACESQGRIMAQKDPVAYAEMMGRIARDGGAVIGDPSKPIKVGDQQFPQFVTINPANFNGDREATAPWNPARAFDGQRSMGGQLNDAIFGQQMAQIAGARDGRKYEYVAAGVGRPPSQTGEGLFDVTTGRPQFKDACPPASIDVVACMNHVNGGGGLLVHESMAAQFRLQNGQYPPGMVVFKDANDLRDKLKEKAGEGKEMQIVTNGTMVAGMDGHGLHAQGVYLKDGQLVFRNNWTSQHNERTYSDGFVNAFTDSRRWGQGYRPAPGEVPPNRPPRSVPGEDPGPGPDGKAPPYRNEYMNDERDARQRQLEQMQRERAQLEEKEKAGKLTKAEQERLSKLKEEETKLQKQLEAEKKQKEQEQKEREREQKEREAREKLREKEIRDKELEQRQKDLKKDQDKLESQRNTLEKDKDKPGNKEKIDKIKEDEAKLQKEQDKLAKERKDLFTPEEKKYKDARATWEKSMADMQKTEAKDQKSMQELLKKFAELIKNEPMLVPPEKKEK